MMAAMLYTSLGIPAISGQDFVRSKKGYNNTISGDVNALDYQRIERINVLTTTLKNGSHSNSSLVVPLSKTYEWIDFLTVIIKFWPAAF